MTHFPKKKPIKLRDYTEFRKMLLEHFPDLDSVLFVHNHVTVGDIELLVKLCNYPDEIPAGGNVSNLEPLVNYMVDNKHMYEWWKL